MEILYFYAKYVEFLIGFVDYNHHIRLKNVKTIIIYRQ